MTDAGLVAPSNPPPPQAPQAAQQTIQPVQLLIPQAQQIQPVHVLQSNGSHFKPEFSGKPEEDVEAHLLRTSDWMDTCAFQKVSKSNFLSYISRRSQIMVQITKTYKCRLGWINQFRLQYSKIGKILSF